MLGGYSFFLWDFFKSLFKNFLLLDTELLNICCIVVIESESVKQSIVLNIQAKVNDLHDMLKAEEAHIIILLSSGWL